MGGSDSNKPVGQALAAGVLALAGLFALATPVAADTFTPTRFDDPPAGKCRPNDCSFREALIAANATLNKKDTVLLGKGTYEMELPPPGPPVFEVGQFSIFTPVTVEGKGPARTKIDGNGLDRVISIGSGITANGKVQFQGVTIKGGDAEATGVLHGGQGGGILAAGEPGAKLVLSDVAVRGNAAELGGGIYAQHEAVAIRNSTITGNNADEGGGIHAVAGGTPTDIAVRASTISGNSAGKGGGILADGSSFFGPDPPTVDLLNSTVAENHTSAEGGGVMADNDAEVTLRSSTVAYNMADDNNTGGGVGGGIHQHSGATFNFKDSVLALNTVGSSGSGPACDGDFTDGGSLVDTTGSNPNCDFLLDPLKPPTVTTVPLIGPLAKNGGPTKTIQLLSGSPALGIALECPNRDQRGHTRPDEDCDAGSFERKGS